MYCESSRKEMLHVALCVDLCVQNWLIGSLEHPASLASRVSIGVVILQEQEKSDVHFHSFILAHR